MNEYLNMFEYLGVKEKTHIHCQKKHVPTPIYVFRTS